jgi:hypothetical protein
MKNNLNRRTFLERSSLTTAGLMTTGLHELFATEKAAKKRVAMVGTGSRGTGMWGRPVIRDFSDIIEFAGLYDINDGRVSTAQKFLGGNILGYTDFKKMMKEQKPDILIVTTVDATHSDYVIRAMELGPNAEQNMSYSLTTY